ncbi:PrsW family intramembrane metalloprotease [Streptomyces laculatispora]|uniref:PrsW family intramembrane metalloprotease n=1 Tax=Streptomyces laculatispora TaxID=887464 RepID=A0ABY9I210_9ACTN|nr:PrsW family intramembrane metalloprotease [Streptomyces laculatispora]WLQ40881.1 PrsW family intramembrane metalloprotease [Streptomyces laculatispora]
MSAPHDPLTAHRRLKAGSLVDARAPIGVDGFFQPRRAAFWLFVFFLVNGVFSMVSNFYVGYRVVPTAVVLATLVWALYALPFLLFFRSLDLFEQHPPLGFAMAFAWGGFAACYLAIPVNSAVESLSAKLFGPEFTKDWGPALAGPINEEILKLLGIVVLVMIARTQFRTILSVVVLGAMIGLGFQIVEDLLYSVNTAIQFPYTDQVVPVGLMFLVRGVFSGIWSHALYTSVAAFGIGYFITRRHKPLVQRTAVAVGAFALAWFLHFFWNSPWLQNIGGGGVGGVLVLSLLKGIPVLAVGYLLWRFAGHEEGSQLRTVADYYIDDDLMTAEERDSLTSLRERRHLRKHMRQAHGRKAARTLHRLQRAQLHMIRVCEENGAGVPAARAAQDITALRTDLAAATA